MPARWACVLLLAMLVGCGNPSAPLPPVDAARAALEAGLETWKAGKPASALSSRTPKVELIDYEWRANAPLVDFRILGEKLGQGAHTFEVTLTLKGKAPRDVTYHILGTESLQIYREEDFARAMNMDNNPAPKGRAR